MASKSKCEDSCMLHRCIWLQARRVWPWNFILAQRFAAIQHAQAGNVVSCIEAAKDMPLGFSSIRQTQSNYVIDT